MNKPNSVITVYIIQNKHCHKKYITRYGNNQKSM